MTKNTKDLIELLIRIYANEREKQPKINMDKRGRLFYFIQWQTDRYRG